MKKEFTAKEAKDLVMEHQSMLASLNNVIKLDNELKNNIKKAADSFVVNEILNILRSVPVDELNREKKGIRIKALIDYNYTTMADLYVSSVNNIASVRGISTDTAYKIKKIVNDFVAKTRKEIKIKLSVDDRNKYATELVKAISIYKNSLSYVKNCNKLLNDNGRSILKSIDELKPAISVVRWLFTFKSTKIKALEAYADLSKKLSGDYGMEVHANISTIVDISKTGNAEAWNDFAINNIKFFNILEETNPGLLGTDDVLYGLPEDLAREIQEECFFPDGLKCTLRRYQEWGVKYILHQERVLLGDEMGLGKTIQAIAAMVSLRNTKATHFIVVCPASVVTNWCREITKHSLLRATKVHGSDRSNAIRSWKRTGGVAVTTYETVAHFEMDNDFRFDMLIVDEAHYIKNPEARRTINTKELCKHTDRLLFMTGTALENRVEEMLALISILQPQVAQQARALTYMSHASQFRNRVAPVYYRRKREDVLTELPELIESKEWCTMTKEEENIYERAILDGRYMEARRVSWNVDNMDYSSKANRLKEIVDEAESEDRKIIVFSYFLDTIRKISLLLGGRCLDPINGAVSPSRRQEIIDEFDKAPAGSVLVAQIQSGGTGLNIQSASVVIICEPQFKPSIENQAISRAYRMGQARSVLVYRLLCENSIDERITDLLENKQAIFNAFADKSVAAQMNIEVDEKSFGDIISSEIDRINEKRGIHSVRVVETNKNGDYYDSLMGLSYAELVDKLLLEHGPAEYDYFVDVGCKTKNHKVSRSKEGLFCHHIDEDKAIMLSNDKYASENPFTYQKADRLVYCNFLEHLLLHVKIVEEPRKNNANSNELPGIGGAVNFIVRQLNDLYGGHVFTQEYLAIAARVVENDYDSYITILKRLWNIVKNKPEYSSRIRKEDLARGWKGNIVMKILEELD